MTVKLQAGARTPNARQHLCTAAVKMASPGDIIVVEQNTGIDAAGWGGILSHAAYIRGLSGAIVEGPARDLNEAFELGFPVFSRSATARTARGRIIEAGTGLPVRIGDVEVSQGDYVVADASGVVFVPADSIAKVLDAAEIIAAREEAMLRAVLAGTAVGEVMWIPLESLPQQHHCRAGQGRRRKHQVRYGSRRPRLPGRLRLINIEIADNALEDAHLTIRYRTGCSRTPTNMGIAQGEQTVAHSCR